MSNLESNITIKTRVEVERKQLKALKSDLEKIEEALKILGRKTYSVKANVPKTSLTAIDKLKDKLDGINATIASISTNSAAAIANLNRIAPGVVLQQPQSPQSVAPAVPAVPAVQAAPTVAQTQAATQAANQAAAQVATQAANQAAAQAAAQAANQASGQFSDLEKMTVIRAAIGKKPEVIETTNTESIKTPGFLETTKNTSRTVDNKDLGVVKTTERIRDLEKEVTLQYEMQKEKQKFISNLRSKDADYQAKVAKAESDRAAKEAQREADRGNKAYLREKTKQDKLLADNYFREEERVLRLQKGYAELNAVKSQGFKQTSSSFKLDKQGNIQETIQYYNVARVGAAKYEVQLAKLNTTTGEFTKSTLQGAAASKFLGDNLLHAAEKVMLWMSATTIIFSAIAAIRRLSSEIVELEANTVFLARVGRNLGGDFETRIKAANRLTESIIQLTGAIGGNAIEAQRAASVFLRAGQTEQETLISVKAALIAARIAELEVEDAAVLLSSALQQFDMSAQQLMPTLDSLNTLSNFYRVTTDDLLQSISRAGSVFAEHNGRLTELAAITAIVSERTARSGTQIGNAIKTIESRLDRLDIKRDLFENLGISTVNLEGEIKSLSTVLLEMQSRMDMVNQSQQNSLTLNTAGIRQRNILVAAMKEAHKIIEAENTALLNNGSAVEELGEQSKTLDAALSRISGRFSEISNAARTPIGFLAKEFINVADAVLHLLTIFNGYPLKAGIIIASTFGISMAIKYLLDKLIHARFSSMATAVQWQALGLVAKKTSLDVKALAASIAGANTVAGASKTGSFLKSLATPANAAAAAFLILGPVVNYLVESFNAYDDSLESNIDKVKTSIEMYDRQRQAIKNTTDALIEMIIQQQRAAKSGESQDEQEKRFKEAKRVADSAKINYSQVFNLSEGDIQSGNIDKIVSQAVARDQVLVSQKMSALEKLRTSQLDKIKQSATDLNAKKSEIDFMAYVLEAGGAPSVPKNQETDSEKSERIKRQRGTSQVGRMRYGLQSGRNIDDYGYRKFPLGKRRDIEKLRQAEMEEIELRRQYEEYISELSKTEEVLEKLKAVSYSPDKQRRLVELSVERAIQNPAIDALYGEQSARKTTSENAGVYTVNYLQQEYDLVKNIADARIRNLEEEKKLRGELDPGDFENEIKLVNKLLDDQLKIRNEIYQTIRKSRLDFSSSVTEDRDKIAVAQMESLLAVKLDRNSISGPTADLLKNKSRQDMLKADIESNVALIKRLKDEIDSLDLEQQRALESELPGSSKLSKLTTEAEAAKLDTQKKLLELKDLEVQKAIAVFEAEKNIAIERRKSREEAARALGLLTEEDKLRLKAQAHYFSMNPDSRVSLLDQFYGSSENNRIGRQFFGSRFDNEGQLLDRLPRDFGSSPELLKQQRLLTEYKNGLSPEDIAKLAAKSAEELLRQSKAVVGDNTVNGFSTDGNRRFFEDKITGAGRTVTLELDKRSFHLDMNPVVDAFKETYDSLIQVEIPELFNSLKQYVDRRLDNNRLPARRQ